MVERRLPKPNVAGSSPVFRSKKNKDISRCAFSFWSAKLGDEHCLPWQTMFANQRAALVPKIAQGGDRRPVRLKNKISEKCRPAGLA